MTLELLMQNFTVCKVYSLPPELLAEEFFFVGKTDRELSLVCETAAAPAETVAREDGWRALRVRGVHLRHGLHPRQGTTAEDRH